MNTPVDTSAQKQASCADDYDPNALTVPEALRAIDDQIESVVGYEKVALRSALGRVCAEDVLSPIDVPSHTNSAMDGYALSAQDLPESGTADLRLVGSAFAGSPHAKPVDRGECVRIMTGGVMPPGTDTVVMQEHVQTMDGLVRIGPGEKAGQNVRQAGEDLTRDALVIGSGTRLRPAELGLLASLGYAEIKLRRRPRVAFFSTGDELRSVGEILGKGEIYDSNRYTLHGMLTRLGVEVLDMGVVRDRREDLAQAFHEAAEQADAVITSGGVSVGEADFVKEILAELGEVGFWKIAMKPGRPLAFGRVGDAVFFGLPGNPVSVMVTFYQFVQPALRRMMGETPALPHAFPVVTESRLRKRPGRVEYQRGILARNERGELTVRNTGQQGSGILSSVSHANCFIVLPHDSGDVEPGALVEVQPFEGIL